MGEWAPPSMHRNDTIRAWADATMVLLERWDWGGWLPDAPTTLYVVECEAEQFYADAVSDGIEPSALVDVPLALRVLAVHFWATGGKRIKDR